MKPIQLICLSTLILAAVAACSKNGSSGDSASAPAPLLDVEPSLEGLMTGAAEGDLPLVRTMVRKGINPDKRDEQGATALIRAALAGRQNVVRFLADEGADLDAESDTGVTPLMGAISSGFTNVAHYLVEKGADVEAASQRDGVTPLILACRVGSTSTVNLLLDRGADVNRADKAGNTPLINATILNHVEVVKILLLRGAKVNAQTNVSRNNALGIASLWGYEEIAEILLNYGATSDVREEGSGLTPVGAAAINGHAGVIRLLANFMANAKIPDRAGNTPLHHAARNGHIEAVRALLEGGVPVGAENGLGITPVLAAQDAGHDEIVALLVEAGGKPWSGPGRRWRPFTGTVAGYGTPNGWVVHDPYTSEVPNSAGYAFLPPDAETEPPGTGRLFMRPDGGGDHAQVFYINGESGYWSGRFDERMKRIEANPAARRVSESETASKDGVIFSIVTLDEGPAPDGAAAEAGGRLWVIALATCQDRMIMIDVGGGAGAADRESIAKELVKAMTIGYGATAKTE